jgi:hypothetical protein
MAIFAVELKLEIDIISNENIIELFQIIDIATNIIFYSFVYHLRAGMH